MKMDSWSQNPPSPRQEDFWIGCTLSKLSPPRTLSCVKTLIVPFYQRPLLTWVRVCCFVAIVKVVIGGFTREKSKSLSDVTVQWQMSKDYNFADHLLDIAAVARIVMVMMTEYRFKCGFSFRIHSQLEVVHSDTPIKSIELQLVRVETCGKSACASPQWYFASVLISLLRLDWNTKETGNVLAKRRTSPRLVLTLCYQNFIPGLEII